MRPPRFAKDTDIYKIRGEGSNLRAWRQTGLPAARSLVHQPILQRELEIVKPKRIICVGSLAFELFTNVMPKYAKKTFVQAVRE